MPREACASACGLLRLRALNLCLGNQSLPLTKQAEGWFELTTTAAGPGSRYQFQIDGKLKVPDPASRFQPEDVHGPSEVVDPLAFNWTDEDWTGRPWRETVLYELHVGTFSPEGTFAGVENRLEYLVDLGVTAIELMPLSDFPGKRNWGYDGVLPYAPDSSYGRPEDLKRVIQAAHAKGLMVFLDVVYNHFGPDGNYLREYAPQFFTDRHRTPWGDAINFDGPSSGPVRDFVIHNALYWLEEYHFDGLRLDAVHAIIDDSTPDILTELAERVRTKFESRRQVHLVLENAANQSHYLRRYDNGEIVCYNAQWDDDIHHALHVLLTGETDGYYSDYAQEPLKHLGRCLAEGFAFQGEFSAYENANRGESTAGLPSTAFVNFLQNHDQIGNRAFGDRITMLATDEAVKAAMAVLLLAPSPPLLFMGEEFSAGTPFLFFCDFTGDLATAVTTGRRSEFSRFKKFNSPETLSQIPDPNAVETFLQSKLNWSAVNNEWLDFYRGLLRLRKESIIPLLNDVAEYSAQFETMGGNSLKVEWKFGNRKLSLLANLGPQEVEQPKFLEGEIIYSSDSSPSTTLPPWFVRWAVQL